ncbi:DUF4214 domain-containing protein [Halomonas sp. 15WGF]|jgi:hypothetical protein|uniref:beta strand repeat-containing protein n=1 Tax=Halomonas sp. 15WGF TaxID=2570357 RepID=UPI0010BEBE54|nr:DUF4214 domain-containing protein [Halomonas sp. 15WGF]
MATQESLDLAQMLYVAYYGRPADRAGLNYWADEIDANGVDAMVNAFGNSAEFEARFGNLSNEQLINNLYQQMFGRSAELAGLDFYSAQLANGESTLAEIALDIANGAQNEDATALSNKVAVAANFTAAIDTTEEVLAYAGDSAANSARDFLATVNAETDAETVDVDAQLSSLVQADQDETTAGETFTLTAGPDTLTGTTGNDTFNALTVRADGTDATTLSAFDSIDGGAGEDTLNIYTDTGLNQVQQGTVKNVEVINIFNATAGAELGSAATSVDASGFEGAEQVWQIDNAIAVTELAETTAAGFRNTEQATLAVTAAAAAASATIALDGAQGNSASAFAVNVDGEALNAVNVAGSIEDGLTTDAAGASINLDVTVGEDEQTLTVNTAVDTTLTVDDSASTDKVTSVDASASTGGVTFVGNDDVADIATGEGDDDVTLNTLFSATVTAASVVTGAGDDIITIDTANNITDAGDITVDAGEGDDTVIVADIDDISTGSVIDGGEGTDTLQTTGGTLDAEDYTLLNNVFVNFEELTFTAASAFDASRLAGYNEFNLQLGSTGATGVVKVADNQALTTGGSLTATAAGYDATDAANVVYAGTLDITATANATVTANAETVNLTVNAVEGATTTGTLVGDVEQATISVNNYVEADDAAAFQAADVVVTNSATELEALTSLTLVGDGAVAVTNVDDTDLVTVDASALNTVDANGDAATGLTYTSSNTLAETITLGDGVDALTMNASTVAAMDSIISFNLATDDAGAFDAAASDDLAFGTVGTATAIGEVSAANLDLALVDVASNAGAANGVIFDFGGDTYVFQDANTDGIVNDNDALIQLVGGVDQDLLVDMFAIV